MKKKTIVLIVLACLLSYWILCGIGYIILDRHLKNGELRAFVQDSHDFLAQDEEFLSQYGEISALTPTENASLNKNEYEDKTEYYMTFDCDTERASFRICVFCTYERSRSYRYEVDIASIAWK